MSGSSSRLVSRASFKSNQLLGESGDFPPLVSHLPTCFGMTRYEASTNPPKLGRRQSGRQKSSRSILTDQTSRCLGSGQSRERSILSGFSLCTHASFRLFYIFLTHQLAALEAIEGDPPAPWVSMGSLRLSRQQVLEDPEALLTLGAGVAHRRPSGPFWGGWASIALREGVHPRPDTSSVSFEEMQGHLPHAWNEEKNHVGASRYTCYWD